MRNIRKITKKIYKLLKLMSRRIANYAHTLTLCLTIFCKLWDWPNQVKYIPGEQWNNYNNKKMSFIKLL